MSEKLLIGALLSGWELPSRLETNCRPFHEKRNWKSGSVIISRSRGRWRSHVGTMVPPQGDVTLVIRSVVCGIWGSLF